MKILLIKLGALGDVLRTTPLVTALKEKYPASHLTWVVDHAHADVLAGIGPIDRLWPYAGRTLLVLKKENFDLAINLDKEEAALDCLMAARAPKKMGFGRGADGALCLMDRFSDYAWRLGLDDTLKFRQNKKTYQQISFEQAGLVFSGQEYLFCLDRESVRAMDDGLKSLGVTFKTCARPIVGLNTGSGSRFAGKKLPLLTYADLIRKLSDRLGATIFLLGGREEIERNRQIQEICSRPVVNTGSHTIRRFAAIVKRCDLVVSGDTTAMHVAIAMKVPVVAHFASTCAAEIELYGRGVKIVSPISCAPCYKRVCPIDEQCMKDMEPEDIFQAVQACLGRNAVARP